MVEVKVYFAGWEVEGLDPDTGERINVLDNGKDHVEDEQFRCTARCGWTGDFDWYENVGVEAHEQEEARKAQKPQTLTVPTLTGDYIYIRDNEIRTTQWEIFPDTDHLFRDDKV